jgi:cytochrome c553
MGQEDRCMIRSPIKPSTKRMKASRPKRRKLAIEDGAWLAAVRSIPFCVRCRTYGPVQAAHRNYGKGMGQKTDDVACAALCITCHSDSDNGTRYTREDGRAVMDADIVETVIQLARMGLIGAV